MTDKEKLNLLRKYRTKVEKEINKARSSEYAVEAEKEIRGLYLADVILNPDKFSLEDQLKAFENAVNVGFSVKGIKETIRSQQEFAAQIGSYYEQKFDEIGFGEFMGAVRYSGIMDRYGSEQAARLYYTAEERNLNMERVLANYERYSKRYNIKY